MLNHIPIVGKVDRRECYVFLLDIAPYVQFCPVGDREYTYIFSLMDTSVVDVPQFVFVF